MHDSAFLSENVKGLRLLASENRGYFIARENESMPLGLLSLSTFIKPTFL